MATVNPFDLLGDDDTDDPSQIAAQKQKLAARKPADAPPSKPLPPALAVKEARTNAGYGRGRGGRGSGIGPNKNFVNGNGNISVGGYGVHEGGDGRPFERQLEFGSFGQPRLSFRGSYAGGGDFSRPSEPRQPFRGGYDGGNGYGRYNGTGRDSGLQQDRAGRGNWGTVSDDVLVQNTKENLNVDGKAVGSDRHAGRGDEPRELNKDNKEGPGNGAAEKEQEDKEMTLQEYEKLQEEKRKALLPMKAEERRVELDKELKSMQQLSVKKGNEEIFIKLGSVKDAGKKRENAEDRVKKSVSINEFLKPGEGERFNGRGRGRGRAAFRDGGFDGSFTSAPVPPSIEDPGHFPTLGGK